MSRASIGPGALKKVLGEERPLTVIPALKSARSNKGYYPMSDFWTGWYYAIDGKGDWVEMDFNGPVLGVLFGSVGPDRGIADIYVDGVKVKTIDLYKETYTGNPIFIIATDLADERHTVKIVNTGQKNPNSSATYIEVQGIVVSSSRNQANVVVSYPPSFMTIGHSILEYNYLSTNSTTWQSALTYTVPSGRKAYIRRIILIVRKDVWYNRLRLLIAGTTIIDDKPYPNEFIPLIFSFEKELEMTEGQTVEVYLRSTDTGYWPDLMVLLEGRVT